jgi:hypothetical protein
MTERNAVQELLEMSGLSKNQISRALGTSERNVSSWVLDGGPFVRSTPAEITARAEELIERFSAIAGSSEDRRRGLLASSKGPSMFHKAVDEIPEGEVLQVRPYSVKDMLGI